LPERVFTQTSLAVVAGAIFVSFVLGIVMRAGYLMNYQHEVVAKALN
jgi:hypothetical protein